MGVTIKDVAEAAGVSISTVSKVLNGHYSISEKTAQRVRGIMREMNYYPNANAQSFASGSNHTVVLLANLAPNAAFQNPHMFEIISRRSADAIAVHVGVMSHPLAAVLTRLQFPHIVLGAPDFESQVCWIDNSNTYSGTVAASFLLSRGYKRLAFIGGKSYDLGSALRLQGVKQGLSNAGEKLEDQYIWLGESTRADGFRMAESLLSQKELPDAIICANNYIALGCVDAAAKKGLRIPKDIGIMAFDNFPFSQIIEPPLTVVDINVRDMGTQAAKFLTDIMRHPNMQIQTYITTSNVIVRGSTR